MVHIYRMMVLIGAALLAMIAITLPGGEQISVVSAEETPAIPQLNGLYMYMRDSTGMSPEAPEPLQTELTAMIPNGFVKDGPFGRGILPIMGHVYWRDVGTWSTDPVKDTINLGGELRITMFVKGNGGNGATSSDFIFSISRSGESNPLLQIDANNIRIPAGTEEPAKFEAAGLFPKTNDTTFKAGTMISLNIQARCNGGGSLIFGSQAYRSGFTFNTNSLVPHQIILSTEGAGLEYKDAFMVPWMKLQRIMLVNNNPLDNSLQTTEINAANQTRVLFWPMQFKAGNYELIASLCYDLTGWGNVSAKSIMSITVREVPFSQKVMGFISSMLWIVFLAVVLVLIVVMVRWQRGKTWRGRIRALPDEERSLPLKKQKAIWRSRYREETKLRRESRIERRKRLEEEEAQKGFSLFKKKTPVVSRRKSRAKVPERASPPILEKKLSLEEIGELDLDS